MSTLPFETRQMKEINRWVYYNLLSEAQAHTIRGQYDFDFPNVIGQATPNPAPAPDAAQQPVSMLQTLLSETSIKIALYLGAFFVIAAALILAALSASLRLPTLTVVAIGVGIGAVALKNRMPQPSFILWVVFTTFVPIIASVYGDYLKLAEQASYLYWGIVSGFMFMIWSFSTWYFRSRFFSMSAFAALALASTLICQVFEASAEFYFLALTLAACCGLAGVWLLKRWQNQGFATPLATLLSVLVLGVLFSSLLYGTAIFFFNSFVKIPSGMFWQITTIVWLIAALFFFLSDLLISFIAFPHLTIGSLLLLPWFILAQFHAQNALYALSWWAWGAIFAFTGATLQLIRYTQIRRYTLPLTHAALGLLALGAVIGAISDLTFGCILFFLSAVLLTVLQIIQPRWWVWATAIAFGITAYFIFFHLLNRGVFANYGIYQLAGITTLLLLPDLLLKPDLGINKHWRWPLRTYASLALAISSLLNLIMGIGQPLQTLIIFGVFALLGLAFALRYQKAWLGYAFTSYLTLTIIFTLHFLNVTYWLWPLAGVSLAYYLIGWFIQYQQPGWSNVLTFSGLGFGTLVALSAWAAGFELGNSLPVAVIATLWAAEAFRRRNTWLGFPANGLYLLSYYLILLALKINQPQFFSVGAALLGILMHYLLVRSGSKQGAFITGMSSQLVLLGTTYLQMIMTQNLAFFAALFVQSLIVMLYGIVIRSRSLTFAPIGFVVLGVATAVLSVKGISTVLLVGCTGIGMLLLGILAVFMRESLVKVGKHISNYWIA